MKLSKRELSGFALAPLPVVAPLLLMFGVILFSVPRDSGAAFEAGAQLVLGCYVATLLLGLPIHLILRWKGRHSLAAYLGLTDVGVAIMGGLALICEALFPMVPESNPFAFTMRGRFGVTATLASAAIACICAFIFWLVAVRRTRG